MKNIHTHENNTISEDVSLDLEGESGNNSILMELFNFNDDENMSENEEDGSEKLDPHSLLFKYVKERNVDAVENFAGEFFIKDERDKTPLHHALSVDTLTDTDYKIIEILLEKGAKIDSIDNPETNEKGFFTTRRLCPLLMAVEKNDSKLVATMLQSQINREIEFCPSDDYLNEAPLYVAVRNKNLDIFNLLLEAGASTLEYYENFESSKGQYMECTVHYAAQVGFYDAFVYLFDDYMNYVMNTRDAEGVYSPVSAFLEIYLHSFLSEDSSSRIRNYLKTTSYYNDIKNIVMDCQQREVPVPTIITEVRSTAFECERTSEILNNNKNDDLISLVFYSEEITSLYQQAIEARDIEVIKQNYPRKNPFRSLERVFTEDNTYDSLIEYAMKTTEKDAPDFWLQLKELWLAPYLLMIYMPKFFLDDLEPDFRELAVFALKDPTCVNFQIATYDYETDTTTIIALLPVLFDAFAAFTFVKEGYISYEEQHFHETCKKKFLENFLNYILANPNLFLPPDHIEAFNNTLVFSIQHCMLMHLNSLNFNAKFQNYSADEQEMLLELIDQNMELLNNIIQTVKQKKPLLFKEYDNHQNNYFVKNVNKTTQRVYKQELIDTRFRHEKINWAEKSNQIKRKLDQILITLYPLPNEDTNQSKEEKKPLWNEQVLNDISFFKPVPPAKEKIQNNESNRELVSLGKRGKPDTPFEQTGSKYCGVRPPLSTETFSI